MRSRFGILAFAFALMTLALHHPARAELMVPLTCHPGDYMVGIGGRVGNWVNQVYAICAHFNPATADFGQPYRSDSFGDNGGAPEEDYCQPRNVVTHIDTRERSEGHYWDNHTIHMQYVAFTCAPALFLLNRDQDHHGITSTVKEDGELSPDSASLERHFSDCLPGELGIGMFSSSFLDANPDAVWPGYVLMQCGPVPQAETISQLPPGAKMNTDYYGSDIPGSGAMTVNDPTLCYNKCLAATQCLGWTYVHPGIQGPSAICYLKNPLPAAKKSDCCISGKIIARQSPLTSLNLAQFHRIHP